MVHEVPPSLSRNMRSITILYNLRLKHPQKNEYSASSRFSFFLCRKTFVQAVSHFVTAADNIGYYYFVR